MSERSINAVKVGLAGVAMLGVALLGALLGVAYNASVDARAQDELGGFVEPTQEAFDRNVWGQTIGEYGVGLKGDYGADPELIRAVGIDGTEGYVHTREVFGPNPQSPDEAVLLPQRPEPKEVPLYAEDGRTVIGTYLANAGR